MNDQNIDWSSLLGGLAGVGGLAAGVSGANNQTGILQNALNTIGPTNLGNFSLSGPGGSGASFSGGNSTTNLGNLTGAQSGLAGYGTGAVGATPDLSTLLAQLSGHTNQASDSLTSAFANQPNQQQNYQSAYNNLTTAQQPQNLLAANQLQDSLFGSGNLGSTAGGLASAAFGRGLAQQDSSNQLQATQMAQNQTSLSDQLLNSAFSRFNSSASQYGGATTQNLNNGIGAINASSGLNQSTLAQLQAALAPAYATAAARNGSLQPFASVASSLAGTPTSTSLLGSALGQYANGASNGSGSLGAILKGGGSIASLLGGLFGGSGSSSGTTQTNDPGGFGGLFASMPSSSNAAYTPGYYDPNEDYSSYFSGAGGQAANSGSSLGSLFGAAGSGLGVAAGVNSGGTAGYGSAAAAGANLLGQTGLLGTTASNAIGAAGNAASGNVIGAARNAYGAYAGATAQAGETTAQAAAESAAAQSGGSSAAAGSGAAASGGIAGALSSFLPVYLATQLYSGLTSGSINPILGSKEALSENAQAYTNDWLNKSGPGLQAITGTGGPSQTVYLKDGTSINGDQYQQLNSMMNSFAMANKSNGMYTDEKPLSADQNAQIKQFLSQNAVKNTAYTDWASSADGQALAAENAAAGATTQSALQKAMSGLGYNPYLAMQAH